MTDEMKRNKELIYERKVILNEYLKALRTHYAKRSQRNKISLVSALILFIGSPIFYFLTNNNFSIIFFFYGFIFLLIPIFYSAREIEMEIRDIENELDLLSISEDSIEQRAEKQFKLHQLELKKYYDQTLRHSSLIFFVGLICLILGFAIIGFTLYLVFSSSVAIGISEKIILATLGGIRAILSNFIGIIYIKMYSETIKSLTEFHNRLVLTHYLHFGNFLIGKITDQNLREKTLAEIASKLANQ